MDACRKQGSQGIQLPLSLVTSGSKDYNQEIETLVS